MAEQYLWTPADGGPAIDLTDEGAGYSVEAEGTRGLQSPTYRFATGSYAGVDGEQVHAVTAEAGRPSLGLLVLADGEAQLRARLRGLVRAMRPKAGPGLLTVTTEEGETRSLRCYLEAGLEGDESDDTSLPGRWFKAILKFFAPSPWWQGEQRPIEFGLAAPTPFFPIFPLVLSPSNIQGQVDVDLTDADTASYPVWTITGPGSALTLTNVTTGRSIQVDAAIGDGQTVVIDTRPGQQSVRRGDGSNLMGALTSDPALWPLVEGVNTVSALLTNAGASSRIRGLYAPRYAGI